MIGQLRGKLSDSGEKFIIFDVGGVGYKVFTTPETKHNLIKNQEAVMQTHLVVREDALDLYGFATKEELGFFELLLGVSGVGPKSALSVLTLATPNTLIQAISGNNTDYLIKVSGIGRKLAEKIVLELKDKVEHLESHTEISDIRQDTDTILALQAMGYVERDIRDTLKKIPAEITDTGEKIKFALKNLNH
ncbi:MAG: Holliday junction branch migration protein RuvA [Candidatus Paceibacterota bacterium]|jgi:Holliday junction DNA helicase RuvA